MEYVLGVTEKNADVDPHFQTIQIRVEDLSAINTSSIPFNPLKRLMTTITCIRWNFLEGDRLYAAASVWAASAGCYLVMDYEGNELKRLDYFISGEHSGGYHS